MKCKAFAIHEVGATYEHLGRKRVRIPAGMWLVPNMRHLDNAKQQLGMIGCSAVPTPMVKEVEAHDLEADPELGNPEAIVYRSASMSLLYFLQDLFIAQYAVKELARALQRPQESSRQRLKRVVWFLEGKRHYAQWL